MSILDRWLFLLGWRRGAKGSGYTRLMIEKPFGRDSATFDDLNQLTAAHFAETQLFRLDHYLGKEVILNIASLRWANPGGGGSAGRSGGAYMYICSNAR